MASSSNTPLYLSLSFSPRSILLSLSTIASRPTAREEARCCGGEGHGGDGDSGGGDGGGAKYKGTQMRER
ncbi:hypothetical protein NL676_005426 [Syzygium grande]|nr:hypothetical protein NL676_005426 [Syzygium grande]